MKEVFREAALPLSQSEGDAPRNYDERIFRRRLLENGLQDGDVDVLIDAFHRKGRGEFIKYNYVYSKPLPTESPACHYHKLNRWSFYQLHGRRHITFDAIPDSSCVIGIDQISLNPKIRSITQENTH